MCYFLKKITNSINNNIIIILLLLMHHPNFKEKRIIKNKIFK